MGTEALIHAVLHLEQVLTTGAGALLGMAKHPGGSCKPGQGAGGGAGQAHSDRALDWQEAAGRTKWVA